jgi:hypothetical protein
MNPRPRTPAGIPRAAIPLLAVLLLPWRALAWTSPDNGTGYDPETLVAASAGALTGNWPDYLQAQDIVISAADSLYWPPGLVWLAASGVELRIHGTLLATGTPWEPVTVAAQSGQPGAWSGLIFDDAGGGSLLSGVLISGGEDGINCLSSSPRVEYSVLSGNLSSGLSCFLGGNPLLHRCIIEDNRRYGVQITGDSSPRLEHCLIRGNNREASAPRNAVSIGIQGTNNPQLIACRIEGLGPQNPASGVSLWMSGNPELIGCEITGFRSGVVIQGSGAQGWLEACWIHGNRYTDPMLGGSGINVNTSATPLFRGCTIEDNDWGVTLTSACAPDFGTLADHGANRLHGNGNGGSVWDFYNNTASTVQAIGNWWGTTDPELIELHIHDDGDGAYGAVLVEPIREDSLMAPALSPSAAWIALAAGADLALRPGDRFRSRPDLSYALEGPGSWFADGDSLRWTPPPGIAGPLSLLLRAIAPDGPGACDTLLVWLQPAAQVPFTLSLQPSGADLQLAWTAWPEALGYRLESSPDPRFPPQDTEILYQGSALAAVDHGALARSRGFYRVVALLPDERLQISVDGGEIPLPFGR